MLGIKLVKVPCNPSTFKLEAASVAKHINADTIMIYSSAPSFAQVSCQISLLIEGERLSHRYYLCAGVCFVLKQGVVDDIPGISALAASHGIGLHVDCCLGGFVLPFAAKLGYDGKVYVMNCFLDCEF